MEGLFSRKLERQAEQKTTEQAGGGSAEGSLLEAVDNCLEKGRC